MSTTLASGLFTQRTFCPRLLIHRSKTPLAGQTVSLCSKAGEAARA
jgi:hypothetical protein